MVAKLSIDFRKIYPNKTPLFGPSIFYNLFADRHEEDLYREAQNRTRERFIYGDFPQFIINTPDPWDRHQAEGRAHRRSYEHRSVLYEPPLPGPNVVGNNPHINIVNRDGLFGGIDFGHPIEPEPIPIDEVIQNQNETVQFMPHWGTEPIEPPPLYRMFTGV